MSEASWTRREEMGKTEKLLLQRYLFKADFGSLGLQDLQTMLQNAVCDASVMLHVGLGAASKP